MTRDADNARGDKRGQGKEKHKNTFCGQGEKSIDQGTIYIGTCDA